MVTVNRGRADRIQARSGHIADDPQCTYWAGDFAGVRLTATCPLCHDNDPERFEVEPRLKSNWDSRDAALAAMAISGLILALVTLAVWLS